jgi:hypothetical protein
MGRRVGSLERQVADVGDAPGELGSESACGGDHRLRRIDADHVHTSRRQLASHATGATAGVEHGSRASVITRSARPPRHIATALRTRVDTGLVLVPIPIRHRAVRVDRPPPVPL